MHREILKHKVGYAVLFLGLLLTVISFMGVWPNAWLQRTVILALVLFYFCWGLAMHKKTGDLSRKIIEEYAVVSLFAGGMLLIITL